MQRRLQGRGEVRQLEVATRAGPGRPLLSPVRNRPQRRQRSVDPLLGPEGARGRRRAGGLRLLQGAHAAGCQAGPAPARRQGGHALRLALRRPAGGGLPAPGGGGVGRPPRGGRDRQRHADRGRAHRRGPHPRGPDRERRPVRRLLGVPVAADEPGPEGAVPRHERLPAVRQRGGGPGARRRPRARHRALHLGHRHAGGVDLEDPDARAVRQRLRVLQPVHHPGAGHRGLPEAVGPGSRQDDAEPDPVPRGPQPPGVGEELRRHRAVVGASWSRWSRPASTSSTPPSTSW